VVTLPPAGPAGGKTWTGASGPDIPKFAPNPDGGQGLVKFLTLPDIAVKLARAQGFLACLRKSIVDTLSAEGDPIVAYWKMYADADAVIPRPFHAKGGQAQTIVDDVASLFLFDEISLADAMKLGKEQIAALEE